LIGAVWTETGATVLGTAQMAMMQRAFAMNQMDQGETDSVTTTKALTVKDIPLRVTIVPD